MPRPKIGAHVSVAGGLYNAFANAQAIGAECVQIFGASPRQWAVKLPTPEAIQQFKQTWQTRGIGNVYLHAAYLANLASPDAVTREKSAQNLAAHLRICELLHCRGLIFHIGSGKEAPKENARRWVVDAMKEILKKVPGQALLIMENSAGGGQKLGATIDDLGVLYKAANSPRIKVCIDTAHALESGIIERYEPTSIATWLKQIDRAVGLHNVVALHVNDSKTPFNSHHDRHENIGQGHIGIDGFRALAKEKCLWDKDWLLEVPGFDDHGPDKKNVDILKSCFVVQ